ncbi:MAG: hydroxyacid dehydrogenase, partial [Elusimicrobiota bacterium]
VELLKAQNGYDVTVKTDFTPAELKENINKYDVILIRSATKLTADVLEKADNLKIVGRAGAGVDNVDISAANKKNIVVMNTPLGNTVSTAEHTLALLMAVSRHIPQSYNSMKERLWDRKKYTGIELKDKTIGLIGTGNVGKTFARLLSGFNVKILGYDPFVPESEMKNLNISSVTLDELLKKSDYISLHAKLTDQTKNIINKNTLGKCKRGVYIINCARGPMVNTQDLLEAIKSGQVAGAAMDVFVTEPPNWEDPIFKNEKVVFTPHLAASTKEAQENVAIQVAEQVITALAGKGIINSVNIKDIKPKF